MSQFHWADYLVMVAMLLVSMATGIYFAFCGRGKNNVEEYLLAGRQMNTFPVAFSTFVTWMSGISFLGDPVECYKYGAIYFFLVLGYIISAGTAAPFVSKIHDLKIVSVYEFLEMRYSRSLRIINSLCNIISLILWLGIATYAPALGLSQASGIPVWASITILGTVCTFYVSLGGMKAVIWADTIQMGIMVAGMTAVVIQGSLRVGGITNVFRIAARGGRINILESFTNFNPTVSASLWTFFLGGFFRVNLAYISAQHVVQRYCTVPTAKDARNVALMTMPLFAVMSTLIAMCGMVMYATYADCDPLLAGQIERRDQLVPHLVIDLLGFLPGIPGLFLSAVFSASLSSMSSGMNSISALGLTDLIQPLYERIKGRPMDTRVATTLAKVIALTAGAAITGAAFMTSALGKSIFAFNALLGGAFLGPASGIVFVALVFPGVRSLFAHLAFIGSIVACLVLGLLAQLLPRRGPWEELPLSTAGCLVYNGSQFNETDFHPSVTADYLAATYSVGAGDWGTASEAVVTAPPFSFKDIYQINGLLYGPVGFFLVLFIALGLHMIERMATTINTALSSDERRVDKKGSDEDKETLEFLKMSPDLEEGESSCKNGIERGKKCDLVGDDRTVCDVSSV